MNPIEITDHSALTETEPKRRHQSLRLSDYVYEKILSMIVVGEFAADGRLPTEPDMALKFKVSRPVLREALAKLRDDGVVDSRHGSGTFVMKRPSATVLNFGSVTSISDVQRCFEFRLLMESEVAALAASRRDQAAIDAIEEAMVALKAAVERGEMGIELDFGLHLAIARASQNKFFTNMMISMQESIAMGINIGRTLTLQHPKKRSLLAQVEHRAVVDAIVAGDANAARAAMYAHINNARLRMFDGVPDASE